MVSHFPLNLLVVYMKTNKHLYLLLVAACFLTTNDFDSVASSVALMICMPTSSSLSVNELNACVFWEYLLISGYTQGTNLHWSSSSHPLFLAWLSRFWVYAGSLQLLSGHKTNERTFRQHPPTALLSPYQNLALHLDKSALADHFCRMTEAGHSNWLE